MTHDGQIMIAQAHYQMSQKWYLCLCVYLCVCDVPNIKLVKCKNGICLCVPVSVYVHVCVWYATYKLSIFGMFANESKSVKCEFF